MSTDQNDELLLMRLRDLALVDLDALLAGSEGQQYAELVVTYAEDLGDALRAARGRARELSQIAASGPDPLSLLDASYEVRARDGGREAMSRAARRLRARAEACRSLARLDDLVAHLLPRLLEAERRRASQ